MENCSLPNGVLLSGSKAGGEEARLGGPVGNDKEVLDTKDEGDNSSSDVSVHRDEGNLGSEKGSDLDSGSDDVSVIDWETSSNDSTWSLGSDNIDDEQVNIAKLTQEQQQPIVTDDQATVQKVTVTDAASIEETTRKTCSKGRKKKSIAQHKMRQGGGNRVGRGDPVMTVAPLQMKKTRSLIMQTMMILVPYFDIGMRFKDAKQFRMAVCKYSIQKQAQLQKLRNESTRVRFRCQTRCKWELFASYDPKYECFVVKTYYREHRCFKSYDNELVTYKAEKAKKHVMTQLEGSYVDEYKYLKSYTKILKENHLENTVVVIATETSSSETRTFHRIYVCLHSLEQGWKDGCRKFFRVDGCFLKGIYKGIMLSIVGRDGNNQMFPIAWAKLGHRGDEMKIYFWNCAKATFGDDFIDRLGDLVAKNRQGHDDLLRVADKRLFAEKWPEGHDIAPKIRKKVEELKAESQRCSVQPNGVNQFEVNDGGDQHVVKFNDKTCTCRYWQLSGVLCPHALACIRKGTKARKTVGEEELLPPPVKSMPRKLRKNRRRHKGEPQKIRKGKLRKLTRRGRKMTCKGENKRKKQGGEVASTSGSKKKKARVPTTKVPTATRSFTGVDAAASSVPARPTTRRQ
ncbi:hypothetical protein SLEP1_g41469 [Rubroshorea leprosula]|uniref:SWIM-type domain-containing protein n=1 Tax=Rubroshorea leprosula TaxID=152421 RepID=A0AAV5L6L2_9ROSI|nr:hypothetical protein SLEP1_g41469 [Rubroshorea leprosula]